ncbi:Ap4A phosphorylase II [Stanieria sp. NIES-3757]|nr:Ap4A phosphorylase II [Stanieria sp. NIES-3757]
MTEKIISSSEQLLLEPGTLWTKIVQQTDYARNCGALQSIETHYQFIQQHGIDFLVRTLANLTRKEQAKQKQKTDKSFNPFLPYEQDLFVCNLSPTHLCLLNKFNVVAHHLLIVTRIFEAQENLLNLQDFLALWTCLTEINGLAFYNGGQVAGASQPHKHLQLVPLPFIPHHSHLPIEPALTQVVFDGSVGKIPHFPFHHAIAALEIAPSCSVTEAAEILLDSYYTLLKAVGLTVAPEQILQPSAYNLLATRQWMLLIPRSQEAFQSIAVNSLGFAGSLFVRDYQQMQLLKELTPLTVLTKVAYPL